MPTVDKNAFAVFKPHLPWIKFTLLNVKRNTMQERTILRSSGWNKIYRKFNVTFLHGRLLMRLAKLQLFPIESWSELFQFIPTNPAAYWYIVNQLHTQESTEDDNDVYQKIEHTLCDFVRADIYCLLYYPNSIQRSRPSTFIDGLPNFALLLITQYHIFFFFLKLRCKNIMLSSLSETVVVVGYYSIFLIIVPS